MTANDLKRPLVWHRDATGQDYACGVTDGYAQQMIQAMTPETSVKVMYEVAARCLGLPFDEVFGTIDTIGFSNAEIMEIVALASSKVQAVEATIPNGGKAEAVSGEKETPLPPDSPQAIQLAS